jgi:hypothetical protein
VRLGTCIALELAVAAGAVGGVWFGVSRAADLAGDYFHGREAVAATPLVMPRTAVLPLPAAELPVPPAPPPPKPFTATVFGAPDDELLAPVAETPLAKVKLNHGGTSLSLRLEFASGARAAFKPQQTHPQSDPRREIAAYRLDRLLQIGHVPPAKSGGFKVADLVAAVEPSYRAYTAKRIEDEGIARKGMLYGELSWWIPEIKLVKIGSHGIDEPEGVLEWSGYLQAGAKRPAELDPMLAQIATVIVFDVVTDNADRWSGNNTQGSTDNRTLYFMDNTLAFSIFSLGHATNLTKLYRIQVFPKQLIARLRAIKTADIVTALGGDDPNLGPLLTRAEIRAIMQRRDHLLEYVDRLIAQFGEDAVLALP